MGHNKKKRKPPNQEQSKETDQLSAVKSQCQLAISALRRNPAKAHRLMNDLCLRHPDNPHAHVVRGNLHALEASRIPNSDSALKHKHLRAAAESAQQAASLSPNSILLGAFYATVMYNYSRDAEGFEEATRECERALSIESPIDPAEEIIDCDLVQEMDNVVQRPRVSGEPTKEGRIYGVRKKLESILGKCRKACLSLEKNLGNENPLKDVTKVAQVDTRQGNGGRNEIKKRVSEERSEQPEKGFRMSERKRQVLREEREGAAVRMDKSRAYWDGLSDERKMELIGVRVGDMREYCCGIGKDGFAGRVFSEGVCYAEKNGSWEFFGCYYCDEKFGDSELRLKHVELEHEGEIGQKLRVKAFEFPEIDAEWADLLVNGPWEPVDTPRAIKMIEIQSKSQLGTLFDGNRGKSQLLDQDPNRSPLCCGSERRYNDETWFWLEECISVVYCLPRACRNDQKWPLSDDIERANILREIHRQFQVLVRDKFLTTFNLSTVITCAIEELQTFIPAWQLHNQGLENSPLCICFLEVPHLKKILELLQGVYEVSGSDLGRSDDCKSKRGLITEMIFLTGDSSCLLDDRLLRVEVMPHRHHDGVEDDSDGSASTCSICGDEVAVQPDIDAFTKWLFEGPPISTAEQLALWAGILDDMKHGGTEGSKDFEEQFIRFESLRGKQSKILRQCTSLQAIETICIQELEKREQGGKHVRESYESILKKMTELLVHAKEESMPELDVIERVLAEARNIHHLRGEALKNTSYRSDVLRSSELEDEEDVFIRLAIQKEMYQAFSELSGNDELITNNGGIMWRLLAIYKQSSRDYRGIMLALVRNFIHAKLEALVNEEEKQKSDANTEALLLELAVDAEKNTTSSKEKSDPKLSNKTSKAKKKIKGPRKVNDPKAICGDEPNVAQEETVEQVHFPVVAVSADDIKLREQELRENCILEDRKLKEKLEFQRKLEDEAKQKALAKVTSNEAAPSKVEELTKPVVVCSQRTKRRRKKYTVQAGKNLPLPTIPELEEDLGVLSTCSTLVTLSGSDINNPGLRNDTGEYTCFVNVIVQTFWNLRKFREAFMSRSTPEHVHIGDPCVVCELKEIFIALSEASANKEREAISTTSLRNGLIRLNPDTSIFREPHMYDTSEVLAIILESLHKSTVGCKCAEGSWDCGSDACIAHELFGMDVLQKIICSNCGIEPREEKHTSFFYGMCASSLITIKNMQPESHFDEIFKLAESHDVDCEPQFACDREIGGCGKRKSLLSYLRMPPHVLAIALLWPTDSESREDISATLTALTSEIDMAVFHDGLDLGEKHSLFSMVCYFGQHHICFAYSHELEKWIMYDDETVKDVGCWDDIISMCERGRLQPQFLFFESVK